MTSSGYVLDYLQAQSNNIIYCLFPNSVSLPGHLRTRFKKRTRIGSITFSDSVQLRYCITDSLHSGLYLHCRHSDCELENVSQLNLIRTYRWGTSPLLSDVLSRASVSRFAHAHISRRPPRLRDVRDMSSCGEPGQPRHIKLRRAQSSSKGTIQSATITFRCSLV